MIRVVELSRGEQKRAKESRRGQRRADESKRSKKRVKESKRDQKRRAEGDQGANGDSFLFMASAEVD